MVLKRQKGLFGREAGQVLLIVMLVVIVGLAVGLPLATRIITGVRTSTEEAESQKALAAAEAGIEKTIQGNVPVSGNTITVLDSEGKTNSKYKTTVTQTSGSTFPINGGNIIPKDEGADVWIVSHDANNNPVYSEAKSISFLNLYWGSGAEDCSTSTTAPAAIEVIVVSRNSASDIRSYRYTYDSCNRGNNFKMADTGSYSLPGITGTFNHRTSPQNDLAGGINNIVFMRAIPIYKDAVIAVSACDFGGNNCTSLSTQGYAISSIGTSGQANRKLTVFKGWPQAYLPYLSYGLFVAN